jgi:acetaldehyde dehydrogenase/alcohol dehydrogenase
MSRFTDAPFKMATFSQYHSPSAKHAYAELADFLNFSREGDTEEQKVIRLIEAIEGAARRTHVRSVLHAPAARAAL